MNHEYPESWKNRSVSLGHDWLTGMRGGEKVLELLCEGFPDARIHTLVANPSAVSDTIRRHRIQPSWLNALPGVHKYYRFCLPLFPAALRTIPRPKGELLITTSHCAIKALRHGSSTRHLCYCFTPMRYAWTFHDEYLGQRSFKRAIARPVLSAMRKWDRRTAKRVDLFVAISHHVRRRIDIYYGRKAEVVYPPADTDFYTPSGTPREDFDLVVSALVPYKKVDLAVRAYTMARQSLKVVGVGTELRRLQSQAGPTVEFLGWQSDEAIRDLYRRCRQLIFPGEEDFGIVPVEAMACGTPVIAFDRGGVTETVVDRETGILFREQSEEALMGAARAGWSVPWDHDRIRRRADMFSIPQFIDGMNRCIEQVLASSPET